MNNYIFTVQVNDKREECLIKALQNDGLASVMWGQEIHFATSKKIYLFAMANIPNAEEIENFENGSFVFARDFTPQAVELMKNKEIVYFKYMDDEEFVLKNAYLTAEGALAYIIENTDMSLKNMPVLVLGYGRVGKSLNRILKNNGAAITVATDDMNEYALASAFADKAIALKEITDGIECYKVIINTVPKIILKGDILKLINKNCFILDLASKPGGVDFPAAESLELKCIHALGVPGKFTPETAGIYLKQSIVKRLKKFE